MARTLTRIGRGASEQLPLAGVRVVDLTDDWGASCGRFLADLGADVVLVEPPGGVAARHRADGGVAPGLAFAVNAANKRSLVVDRTTSAGRERLLSLLQQADIWIDGSPPGSLASAGLDPVDVLALRPELVVVSISPFGRTGPYRDRVGPPEVQYALTTLLSQSGVPDRPPVLPPLALAEQVTGVQAAWAALLAYWHRLETGVGDHLDVSVFEAVAQTIDPPIGSFGTAAAAQSGMPVPRGRPPAISYPIFPARDGHVRITALAPRQWRSLFEWLGEPAQFADRRFDDLQERYLVADSLYPLIADRFRGEAVADLVAEGQRRGVPVAPVLTATDVLDAEHFHARHSFSIVPIGDTFGRMPAGYVLVDGERAGIRSPAPGVGTGDGDLSSRRSDADPVPRPHDADARPLAGLRVLDLGVIVMGAEAGRLFADQGADVIKIETRAFPDAARAAGINPRTATGQRNKRSFGLNLRDPAGVELFERLVALSDVVLTNFKPGTLAGLGLDVPRLQAINPGAVVTLSSAMGESGPLRDWMGYGPLVRCVAGMTSRWRDPEDQDGFADGTTIFPDHFAARVVDAAVLAALIRRRRTGRGAVIEAAQAEAVLGALAPVFLEASLPPAEVAPTGHRGVYPCIGDDEWCVICVRDDDDWKRLVDVLGAPAFDASLAEWTSKRSARDVAARLQAAGVPAAPMYRTEDFVGDPHLSARGFVRFLAQPQLAQPVATENGPAVAARMPDPPLGPAPLHGQHSREISRELLGLDDSAIDDLITRGVLEEPAPELAAAANVPADAVLKP